MDIKFNTNEVKERSYLPFLRQCFITISVTLNMMTNGCVGGYAAILLPSLRVPESRIRANDEQESWIASITGFSLIFGNLAATPALDMFGRKKSHLLSVVPMIIGWILILSAQNVAMIITGRFIQGFAMGVLTPLAAIIISEMTDPKSRGPFLTLISLSLAIGVLFTQGIGTVLSWHTTGLICLAVCVISLILVILTPESPSWLLSKGRVDECKKIFRWLRGTGVDEEAELESMILNQLLIRKGNRRVENETIFERTKSTLTYLKGTCRKPEFYKPMLLMFHMYTMLQFCGLNVMVSYMPDVITTVVGPQADPRVWMTALNIERLIANILAIYFIGIFKRRTLLFATGTLCLTTYVGQAVYVLVRQNYKFPDEAKWIPMALLGLYVFGIGAGLLALPMAMSGEIFPLEYRGLGGSFSVFIGSIGFFFAIKCYPGLVKGIGLPYTYFIYSSIMVYCMTVVYFMLPETKDKTLQEIEDGFRGSNEEKTVMKPLRDVEEVLVNKS